MLIASLVIDFCRKTARSSIHATKPRRGIDHENAQSYSGHSERPADPAVAAAFGTQSTFLSDQLIDLDDIQCEDHEQDECQAKPNLGSGSIADERPHRKRPDNGHEHRSVPARHQALTNGRSLAMNH
jgi:hypothetical protein